MTRSSQDEYDATGYVQNGYDYALQVWVLGGIVQRCGHPERMRQHGPCCDQARYAGQPVAGVFGAERRVRTSEA